MADLRITDAALLQAQATWQTAGSRLAPVMQALRGLDADVVGADPLTAKLASAQEVLAADIGIIGQSLAELADHAAQIGSALTQTDVSLGQAARAVK